MITIRETDRFKLCKGTEKYAFLYHIVEKWSKKKSPWFAGDMKSKLERMPETEFNEQCVILIKNGENTNKSTD